MCMRNSEEGCDLAEQRDKAVLSTTKAVCQAIIDRIDGKEN